MNGGQVAQPLRAHRPTTGGEGERKMMAPSGNTGIA